MIDFRIIPVTPFQQNCSLLWCADTRQAATLDQFLAWGMKNYPAKKTMVVMAGHGEGFAGYAADGEQEHETRRP